MEIKTLDQTIRIDLDTEKRTGVLVSGGMDSAILLFLILKEIKDLNISVDLTVYNVPNVNDGAMVYSKQVVDYLEKYFDTKINLKNVGSGAASPLQLITAPAKLLLETGEVDVLYSGQNQFPEEAKTWKAYKDAQGLFKRRSPDAPDSNQAKFPFIRLHKHHILEIYRQSGVLNLASITHSCTTRVQGKCQECLWCKERTWAFTKLGLEDL
jgi:hypothetical protein